MASNAPIATRTDVVNRTIAECFERGHELKYATDKAKQASNKAAAPRNDHAFGLVEEPNEYAKLSHGVVCCGRTRNRSTNQNPAKSTEQNAYRAPAITLGRDRCIAAHLTLALSGGAMVPNIALLFDRPLEREVRLPHDAHTVSRWDAAVKTLR